jgi:hypothetical protein
MELQLNSSRQEFPRRNSDQEGSKAIHHLLPGDATTVNKSASSRAQHRQNKRLLRFSTTQHPGRCGAQAVNKKTWEKSERLLG